MLGKNRPVTKTTTRPVVKTTTRPVLKTTTRKIMPYGYYSGNTTNPLINKTAKSKTHSFKPKR